MVEKYIAICEKLDWTVHEYQNGDVELEKYSPAGEDFTFVVRSNSFVDDVKRYAAYFDRDEHIEMWVAARQNGTKGVPSIRELVEDAEAIDKMLQELAVALAEAGDEDDTE